MGVSALKTTTVPGERIRRLSSGACSAAASRTFAECAFITWGALVLLFATGREHSAGAHDPGA